jgi:hypothetical protein
MNPADWFAALVGGVVGGAIVWHYKDALVAVGRKFVSWFKGAQYLAAKAQQDAVVLEQKLAAAKAAASAVVSK